MEKAFLIRLGLCIALFGACLYSYIDRQNRLTQLRIQLPEMEKSLRALNEEIRRYQYEIDQFENPAHLMELARSPEFSHLKHPLMKDILEVPQGVALQETKVIEEAKGYFQTQVSIPVGAKH